MPKPESSPDQFRELLLGTVADAYAGGVACAVSLDPLIHALVIPAGYSNRKNELSEDLDDAVQALRNHDRKMWSVAWSSLRETAPPYTPTFAEWAGDMQTAFAGETGLVFFVDIEALAQSFASMLRDFGLASQYGGGETLVVGNGKFTTNIKLHALVVEALWTARGPLAILRDHARALPNLFRAYEHLGRGLLRRFPGSDFVVDGEMLVAQNIDGKEYRLDYRRIVASARAQFASTDEWLARVCLDDLAKLNQPSQLMLKSDSYLRAYPDAVHRKCSGYVVVAGRAEAGWVATVRGPPADNDERFHFHSREARRHVADLRYDGRVFALESDDGEFVVVAIGDHFASLALHDDLLRALARQVAPERDELRVMARSEDALLLASSAAANDLILQAFGLASRLLCAIYDDGQEPVSLQRTITIDGPTRGDIVLSDVPRSFFLLLDSAEQEQTLHPAQALLLTGLALRSIGLDDKATQALTRAYQKDPSNGETCLALGSLCLDQGDPCQALPLLQRASLDLPQRADVANALGVALRANGDDVNARRAFVSAVEMAPDEPVFLVNLAKSLLDENDLPQVRSLLDRALSSDPGSADAHATLAFVCRLEGEGQKARAHVREALAYAPDENWARTLLGIFDDDEVS